jgi:redox-sensitive bicupin YhaK (pirin superfamily)
MNAGSGIHHEEAVQKAETVEMLQIFSAPVKKGCRPMCSFMNSLRLFRKTNGN